MSMTKAEGWDTFEKAWDEWVLKTNDPNATLEQMEEDFKTFSDTMMDTLVQVNPNHPGPPPPRIRPGS